LEAKGSLKKKRKITKLAKKQPRKNNINVLKFIFNFSLKVILFLLFIAIFPCDKRVHLTKLKPTQKGFFSF